MNLTGTLLLASALCLSVCAAQDTATTSSHTTAKQDMKDAGQATKNAAKDTGSAAKDAGHATKKTSKKVVNKSASKTEEGADKVRQDGSATLNILFALNQTHGLPIGRPARRCTLQRCAACPPSV